MDGYIFVDSAEGKGSCFYIVLKNVLIPDDDDDDDDDALSKIQIQFEPAKILLVDDVAINRELVRAYLAEFKELTFVEAESGEEALSLAQHQSFDLVFMDRLLPVMNGDVVCWQMKFINPDIPIIMISATVTKESEDKAAVFYDVELSKPVNKTALLKAMRMYLKTTEINVESDDILKTENQIAVVIDSEKLSEFLALLVTYQDEINSVKDSESFNMYSLTEMAEQLVEIAEKYHCPSLKEWANTLKEEADLFDVVNLSKTLKRFDALCDGIG